MTTLSPMRTGRITASRVAAIIGKDKYRSRDDALREMVRQALGAPPEFTGNEATQWGNDHEEDARAEYERTTGTLVLDAQDFITHPDIDWLGCSPDGLLGDDGMVEFKSPWRARYRTIKAKPEYEAQVQMQLAVTGRAWAHFVIYRVGEPLIIEKVDADPDWLPSNLTTLSDFHREFLEIIADPKKSVPFLTDLERTDPEWTQAAEEFLAADIAVDEAGQRLERAKARLKELAGEHSAKGSGVSVSRSERAGSVDWKGVAGKYAPEADPEEFRKASSVVWTIRATS